MKALRKLICLTISGGFILVGMDVVRFLKAFEALQPEAFVTAIAFGAAVALTVSEFWPE